MFGCLWDSISFPWSWCLVIRSAVVSCVLHIWVPLAQHDLSHAFWSNVPKLQEGEAIKTCLFVLILRDETGKGHNPFQSCSSAWIQALVLLFADLPGFFITCSKIHSNGNKTGKNELYTFLSLTWNPLCCSCAEWLSRQDELLRDQIHFKWSGHFTCGVTHPQAAISHSRVQPKQQTLSSSPLEIFVVDSLAADLPALTFRSGRRGRPVLPPLCAWPLQQLLLQKDSPSGGTSFGWRLGCPVASGVFASAVAGALCAVGTVARIALIWHQSCSEMDYLLFNQEHGTICWLSTPKGLTRSHFSSQCIKWQHQILLCVFGLQALGELVSSGVPYLTYPV